MGYPAELEKINITFEPASSVGEPPELIFVETEDLNGKGIGIGEWVDLEDGRRALQIQVNQATIRRS